MKRNNANNNELIFSIIEFIKINNFKSGMPESDLRNFLRGKVGMEDYSLARDLFFAVGGVRGINPENPELEVPHLYFHNEGLKMALDYVQLQEAREFSGKSLNRSNWAIAISIVIGCISLFFNWYLVSRPTKVELSEQAKIKLEQLFDDSSKIEEPLLINFTDEAKIFIRETLKEKTFTTPHAD